MNAFQYPNNDKQFQEATVAAVLPCDGGWSIRSEDGWSFYVPETSQVVPKIGTKARFYGRGYPVRGLFLDGQRVFYRTEVEDIEKTEIDLYGADAADWLRRWDAGQTVWSISMGGLGPGYEQCIQIVVAEILRHLLERKYDVAAWDSLPVWEKDHAEIDEASWSNPRVKKLGPSGAQWGAAMELAASLYRYGPRTLMTDERTKDRHIQVRRSFPSID